jgi:hypothetical protein
VWLCSAVVTASGEVVNSNRYARIHAPHVQQGFSRSPLRMPKADKAGRCSTFKCVQCQITADVCTQAALLDVRRSSQSGALFLVYSNGPKGVSKGSN